MAGFTKLALQAPYVGNKPPLVRPKLDLGWMRSEHVLSWYSIEADVYASSGDVYDICPARDCLLATDSANRSNLVRSFVGHNLALDLINGLSRADLRRVLSPLLEWRTKDNKVSVELLTAAVGRAARADLSKTGCADVLEELYNAELLPTFAQSHSDVLTQMLTKALGGDLHTHIGQIPRLRTVCVLVDTAAALRELTIAEQHAIIAIHPTNRAVTVQGYISWIAAHAAEFDGAEWLDHLVQVASRAGSSRAEVLSGVVGASLALIADAAAHYPAAANGRRITELYNVPVQLGGQRQTWDGLCAVLTEDVSVNTWFWVTQVWEKTSTGPSTGAAAMALSTCPGLLGLIYAADIDDAHCASLVVAANRGADLLCSPSWLSSETVNMRLPDTVGELLLKKFVLHDSLLAWLLTSREDLFISWCAGRFANNPPTVEMVRIVASNQSYLFHQSVPTDTDLFAPDIFETLMRTLPGVPWHVFCYGESPHCSEQVTRVMLLGLAEHVGADVARWAEVDRFLSDARSPSNFSLDDILAQL